jgi:hypothetical protein
MHCNTWASVAGRCALGPAHAHKKPHRQLPSRPRSPTLEFMTKLQCLAMALLAMSVGCAAKMPEPTPPLPEHERATSVGPELTRLTEPMLEPEPFVVEHRTRLHQTRVLGQANNAPVYDAPPAPPVAPPTSVTNISTTVNVHNETWGGGFGWGGWGGWGGPVPPRYYNDRPGYGYNDERRAARRPAGPPTTVGGDWAPPHDPQPPLIQSFGR